MRMLLSSLLIAVSTLALAPLPADVPLRGFFPQSVQAERDLETRFKAMPDPSHMREAMRRLSARPHHVGSPYDREKCRMDSRSVQVLRLGCAHREFRRAVSDTRGARRRARRADHL